MPKQAAEVNVTQKILRIDTRANDEMIFEFFWKQHPLFLPVEKVIHDVVECELLINISGISSRWDQLCEEYTWIERIQFCLQVGIVELLVKETVTTTLELQNVYVSIYGEPQFCLRGIYAYIEPFKNDYEYYLLEWKAFCIATLYPKYSYALIKNGTYLLRQMPSAVVEILEVKTFEEMRYLLMQLLQEQRENDEHRNGSLFIQYGGYVLFGIICLFHFLVYFKLKGVV